MLRNYLIAAWRNLRRYRIHTAINIVGLALSMSLCLLVLRYVQYERSWDGFHPDAEAIHLVRFTDTRTLSTPAVLGPTVRQALPGVEQIVRLVPALDFSEKVTVSTEQRAVQALAAYADPAFSAVVGFETVAGNLGSTLARPDQVALTHRLAGQLFTDVDPVGQRLQVQVRGAPGHFTVGAVVEVPENTSLPIDMLMPIDAATHLSMDWSAWTAQTFVKLEPGVDVEAVADNLTRLLAQHFESIGMPVHERISGTARLLPLRDLRFAHDLSWPYAHPLNPMRLVVLVSLAVGILFVACANYMVLATAAASARAREVGIRKITGATRRDLIHQFFAESCIAVLVALAIAAILSQETAPIFGSLIGSTVTMHWGQAWWLVLLTGLVVSVGVGLYPAVALSGLGGMENLAQMARSRGSSLMRHLLVVAQLAVSIALIVSVLLGSHQLAYLQNRDLGFEPDHLLLLPTRNDASTVDLLGNSLLDPTLRHSSIVSAAAANMVYGAPVATVGNQQIYEGTRGTLADGSRLDVHRFYATVGFARTMGLRLLEGEFLESLPEGNRREAVVVNEAFVRALGLDEPVGTSPADPAVQRFLSGKTICGVVADFHLTGLREQIVPAVIHMYAPADDDIARMKGYSRLGYLLVRIKADGLRQGIEHLRNLWQGAAPGQQFSYTFADDIVAQSLRDEVRWLRVFRTGAAIAVFLASMGVFGVSALTADQRAHEIGIRKALGAPVASLVALLLRELTWLVAAASVLAWPVVYWAASSWLEGYAYHVGLSMVWFVAGTTLALVITWLSAGWHVLRAAWTNPVEVLRHE